jgi:hypothetical protein
MFRGNLLGTIAIRSSKAGKRISKYLFKSSVTALDTLLFFGTPAWLAAQFWSCRIRIQIASRDDPSRIFVSVGRRNLISGYTHGVHASRPESRTLDGCRCMLFRVDGVFRTPQQRYAARWRIMWPDRPCFPGSFPGQFSQFLFCCFLAITSD